MCGIIGIFDKSIRKNKNSDHSILNRLCTALHLIEYRGYDSCGVAVFSSFSDVEPKLIKTVGEVKNLEVKLKSPNEDELFHYNIGIAHTRWATHGTVTEANAHPIKANGIYIVHNGVLENYHALKSTITSTYKLLSDTDTEVIAVLLDKEMEGNKTLMEAAIATLNYIRGTGSYIAVSYNHAAMVVTCMGTPMIIGKTDNDDFYIVSDVLAFPESVTSIYHMKMNEVFHVTSNGYTLYSKQCESSISLNLSPFKVENVPQIHHNSYSTHTEKEVYEQIDIVDSMHVDVMQKLLTLNIDITRYSEIVMIGCGSSFNACNLVKELILERNVNCVIKAEIASEFSIKKHPPHNNALYILVSQSGETADTIKCLELIGGCDTLGIVNRLHSRLARSTKYLMHVDIGVEVGVASTKSFTSHLIVLSMLFDTLFHNKTSESEYGIISQNIRDMLKLWSDVKDALVILLNSGINKILIIGKGISYYSGIECALKIKELTYIPTEAIPSGELKHGHIALVDEKTLVIAFLDEYRDKVRNNVQEVLARKGNVIAFDSNQQMDDDNVGFTTFNIHNTSKVPFSTPLLNIIIGQMIAISIAQILELNVDKPRNLAKSVTVE
ncbi:glutamine--fructose-6-phosphate transaminase (isomerizing) [Candidatus Fokinia crypta]|uniref:Glutamine--fructose-6-phosphate aminotransferase [isomerizing] n=1 Tax=Candidatus Fokinia crypta TaxID=1920990 RepID=A0ABZ0USP2_9RICK|nr:glutamine--fructose-6-phosphate transaminase (isomerizing) [Candidatus Fokinia cryptica]WPX97935.1 Glutamine--fructose-6-phosphate aminotransferase [Candidatus Fokinia cryptica]